MTDVADLISTLRPVRLPPGLSSFDPQGGLAVVSLSLLAGLAIAGLLRLASEKRPSKASAVRKTLAEVRERPTGERLLRQAEVIAALRETDQGKPRRRRLSAGEGLAGLGERVGAALYPRSPEIDCDAIDAEIMQAATGRGR